MERNANSQNTKSSSVTEQKRLYGLITECIKTGAVKASDVLQFVREKAREEEEARQVLTVRISDPELHLLNKTAKKKNVTRSDVLRNLILTLGEK